MLLSYFIRFCFAATRLPFSEQHSVNEGSVARTQSKVCELDYCPGGNIIPRGKGVMLSSYVTRARPPLAAAAVHEEVHVLRWLELLRENIYNYVYIYIYTYTYMYVYVYVCMYVCVYICVYIYIHIYQSINQSIYLSIYISLYIYLSIHLSLSLYIYIYIYICMQLSLSLSLYIYIYIKQ